MFEYVNSLNRYIVESQPWNLAKEKENEARLAAVLKTLARAILSVNALLSPILPDSAAKVRGIFNAADPGLGWKDLPEAFAISRARNCSRASTARPFSTKRKRAWIPPPKEPS